MARQHLSKHGGDAKWGAAFGQISRWCLASATLVSVLGSHPAIAEDDWPDEIQRYAWMRKDGQRITGNARLEKQIGEDKNACLKLAQESASIVPEKNGASFARGCMAAKNYVLIPKHEIEKRLAEAASASVKPLPKLEKTETGATEQRKQASQDPNRANRQILAMSDKDRRGLFETLILSDAKQCGEVTKAFYRGTARPSYNAIWDIGCSSGPNYTILVMSDEKGSTKIMTCGELRAMGGGECFVKP